MPAILQSMALESLAEPLRAMAVSDADVDEYVWAYFDGRVNPGTSLAIRHLVESGATAERATKEVHAAIKQTRRAGNVFAFGVMTTKAGFLELLTELGAQGLGPIQQWLDEPAAAGHLRMVIVAGDRIQTQHVELT
jgi:hypothetical protein